MWKSFFIDRCQTKEISYFSKETGKMNMNWGHLKVISCDYFSSYRKIPNQICVNNPFKSLIVDTFVFLLFSFHFVSAKLPFVRRCRQPLCRHVIKNQHKLQRQIRTCSSSTARPAIRDVDYEDNVKTIQIPASAYRTKSEPIRHDTDNGELFKVSFYDLHNLLLLSQMHSTNVSFTVLQHNELCANTMNSHNLENKLHTDDSAGHQPGGLILNFFRHPTWMFDWPYRSSCNRNQMPMR